MYHSELENKYYFMDILFYNYYYLLHLLLNEQAHEDLFNLTKNSNFTHKFDVTGL